MSEIANIETWTKQERYNFVLQMILKLIELDGISVLLQLKNDVEKRVKLF